jgi:ubiquinone/menaquinone biosynthesis C-methylase UbiE/uncharacterized protein YbaR (Trm112 family)
MISDCYKYLISPESNKKLIKGEDIFFTKDKTKKYGIINNIPILLPQSKINDYMKNTYKADFVYFKKTDCAFIKNLVLKLKLAKESFILDLGAGEGVYSSFFYNMGMNVVALDFSKYMLEKGQKNNSFVDFIAGDAHSIPFANSSFDVIFCSGLSLFNTEHVKNETKLVHHIISKLRKRGYLIFIASTNLSGKMRKSWYPVTFQDLDGLFSSYNIKYKWFIPRLIIPLVLKQHAFNNLSSKIFSIIIKFFSFLHHKIRGRIIYVIEK